MFASRSPFRPNPIGLSCVELKKIDLEDKDGPILRLTGVDLVDGTPVIDIKPYLPYADSIPDAKGGFAPDSPATLHVRWSGKSPERLEPSARKLIEDTLAIDPRPAYQRDDNGREYGCLINGYNVRWTTQDGGIVILGCEKP